MFIAALSTIAKVWKEPKCPLMDEWMKKMWCWRTRTQRHRKNVLKERDTGTPMFIGALSTIVKVRKQRKCPLMDEWI